MRFAFGADLLIHEATFCEDEAERAVEMGHSTAAEAAAIARRANVGSLALVHLASRYPPAVARAKPAVSFPAVSSHTISTERRLRTERLRSSGGSASTAAAALSTMGATGAVATLGLGVVSDRLSVRAHLTATSFLLLAASALLLLSSEAAAFAGFAALGVCGSVAHVTGGITWARTYGTARIGRLQGVAHGAMIGAAALGPLPLALELGGSLTAGVGALVVVSAVALVAAIIWKPRPSRATIHYATNASVQPRPGGER